MEPLYLRAHTAVRMQPRQLAGIAARKARERVVPRLPIDFDRRYERRIPEDPVVRLGPIAENTATLRACLDEPARERRRQRAREAADGAPTFLNRTLRVAEGSDVEWYDGRFEELPILWSLKLYAFQPLSWVWEGFEPGDTGTTELREVYDGWIDDWISSVDIGGEGYLRRAWTPWAVSLRILSWSRYLAWRAETGSGTGRAGFERSLGRELYKNALFLRNHVERDVGGNHLIENGAALVLAGLVFAERSWVDEGVSILSAAATDQFLEDGYHFERSPMYHVLAVTRYLTVCDLLERSGRPVPGEIGTVAEEGTEFLRFLRPPDGRIPLLNDAVYGEALPLGASLRYAESLGFEDDPESGRWTPPGGRSTERNSGYRWLRTESGSMLVDGGAVGPPQLPGHSHSDTLSVLLWLDGRPVATDTGTLAYAGGPHRTYARSVRAHNTAQVGDLEPIAVGGTYLMGPRPEPTTRFQDGEVSLFEGRYEASPYAEDDYTHHRAVYGGPHWWFVRDAIRGAGDAPVRSRLHLHPEVEPSLGSTGRIRLAFGDGDSEAFVHALEGARVGITDSRYFPRFGVDTNRDVLELYADGAGADPTTTGFLVTQRDLEEATLETGPDGIAPGRLHTDAGAQRLPDLRLLAE